jgi:hypothetical protein
MFPNLDKDIIDDVVRMKEGRYVLDADPCAEWQQLIVIFSQLGSDSRSMHVWRSVLDHNRCSACARDFPFMYISWPVLAAIGLERYPCNGFSFDDLCSKVRIPAGQGRIHDSPTPKSLQP